MPGGGPVAKARIILEDGDRRWSLLSRKRAEGKPKHGQLEMLGGHIDGEETPFAALIRELREEEATGRLATLVEGSLPASRMLVVDAAPHHLFEVRLPAVKCAGLRHDPEESLGLERIATDSLERGERWDELTWRTQRIFEAFGPTE